MKNIKIAQLKESVHPSMESFIDTLVDKFDSLIDVTPDGLITVAHDDVNLRKFIRTYIKDNKIPANVCFNEIIPLFERKTFEELLAPIFFINVRSKFYGLDPVVSMNGDPFSLTIPEYIEGDKITTIASNALSDLPLKEAVLPAGVKCIEEMAFYNCGRLNKVVTPTGLHGVCSAAFADCPHLESVDLHNAQFVHSNAFEGCTGLKTIYCDDKLVATSLKNDYKDVQIICHGKEVLAEGKGVPTQRTYSYGGPVYRFGKKWSDYWEDETSAPSPQKALNNLSFKARKYFGWTKNTQLELDPDYLLCDDQSPKQAISEPSHKIVYCDKCGARLNDGGTCPVCDDNIEDY